MQTRGFVLGPSNERSVFRTAAGPTVISVLKTYRAADVAGLRERAQLVKYAGVQGGRKQWF